MTPKTNPIAAGESLGGPRVLARLAARMFGTGWGSPPPRTKRPSGLLKNLLERTEGEAYDRSPCPHALVVWDSVPDPQRPDDPHRTRARRTLVPCGRPEAHVHERAEAARVHSGAGGTVW